MLYDPKKDSKEIAVKYGIDYIIVSKRINPDLDLEDAGYVKKFANRDIDIYIVK